MTDAMRDAELLANAVVEAAAGVCPEAVTLAGYQRQRDRLSSTFFDTTDQIAAYDWDMARIRRLLRQVSSGMTDELELLEQLPVRRSSDTSAQLVPPDRALARE
jgi:hypothetical protein